MHLNKTKENTKGISLIELALVIALLAILSSASIPLGIGFLRRNNLKNTRDVLVSYLNTAQISSISARNGSEWGLAVTGDKIVLFNGENYSSRNLAFDLEYNIPSDILVTPSEILFDKYSGETTETSITIENIDGNSYTVYVSSEGNTTLD